MLPPLVTKELLLCQLVMVELLLLRRGEVLKEWCYQIEKDGVLYLKG